MAEGGRQVGKGMVADRVGARVLRLRPVVAVLHQSRLLGHLLQLGKGVAADHAGDRGDVAHLARELAGAKQKMAHLGGAVQPIAPRPMFEVAGLHPEVTGMALQRLKVSGGALDLIFGRRTHREQNRAARESCQAAWRW